MPDRKALIQSLTKGQIERQSSLVTLRGGVKIRVSRPIRAGGIYVPMRAREIWELAVKFNIQPLTRAVADQTHNVAQKALFTDTNPSVRAKVQKNMKDYKSWSDELNRIYDANDAVAVSGAHKLWIISNAKVWNPTPSCPGPSPGEKDAVNYGFYIKSSEYPTKKNNCGRYLNNTYTTWQPKAGCHGDLYWDYSQLAQFMWAPDGLTYKGVDYTIRYALQDGIPPLWDETKPPFPDRIPKTAD